LPLEKCSVKLNLSHKKKLVKKCSQLSKLDFHSIQIKKSPVTTVDVFQLKILEKCQRINVKLV